MLKYLLVAILYCITSLVIAEPYGQYDFKKLIYKSEITNKLTLDFNYLDTITNDLAIHAYGYPPEFDSPQDQLRAEQDASELSKILDIIINLPKSKTESQYLELLNRAAFLNFLAHNLDIPETGEKADKLYKKMLSIKPNDPIINYRYGFFLTNIAQFERAIPYLETAINKGYIDANYTLGMTYLTLGKNKEAITYLEKFQKNISRTSTNCNYIKGY